MYERTEDGITIASGEWWTEDGAWIPIKSTGMPVGTSLTFKVSEGAVVIVAEGHYDDYAGQKDVLCTVYEGDQEITVKAPDKCSLSWTDMRYLGYGHTEDVEITDGDHTSNLVFEGQMATQSTRVTNQDGKAVLEVITPTASTS